MKYLYVELFTGHQQEFHSEALLKDTALVHLFSMLSLSIVMDKKCTLLSKTVID